MTELVSMLVPLQGTLPGWPEVQEPSALEMIGLLIGLPALVFLIVAVLGKRRELVRAGRGEDVDAADEPLWLGSAPTDRAAFTAGAPAADEGRRSLTGSAAPTTVGGASARW